MRNLIDRLWLPLSGSVTSIGFKGIETVKSFEAPILSVPVIQEHSLFYYLLVGAFGAIGGLLVKIAWCRLKKWFPRLLKDIDK